MGKQKSPTSTSPQVVATLSSLLLLIVSAGLGFYFTELRGAGIRTLLSGSQASELMVLIGGLAAVVLTGHLAVANAARSAQGVSGYRKLVRKASEVDYSDPEAVTQFDAVPELRDLVRALVSEKEQGHQLQDALESTRGETQGLCAGMQRSLTDLGKMREDQASELARKVSTLWNVLLERVREAEERSAVVAKSNVSTDFSGRPEQELGASAMEQRLLELEARVHQLHATGAAGATQLLVTEDEIVASQAVPLFLSDDTPEVIDLEDSLDPISRLVMPDEPQTEVDELSAALEPLADAEPFGAMADEVGGDDAEDGAAVEDVAEPETAPRFAGPWQTSAAPSVPSIAAASPPAKTWGAEPAADDVDQGGSGEQDEDDSRTFTEWSGAGFGSLANLGQEPNVGFGSKATPASQGSADGAAVGFGAPAPAFSFTPTAPTLSATKPDRADTPGMTFPKFNAQPGRPDDDHVEVTYDVSPVTDTGEDFMSFDAPAEEAFGNEGPTYEIDDDDVVDLRSLGAVETPE
jgi:hypothetical protein